MNVRPKTKKTRDIIDGQELTKRKTHSIKDGKGDNKFVITVAPQKLICPKGKT